MQQTSNSIPRLPTLTLNPAGLPEPYTLDTAPHHSTTARFLNNAHYGDRSEHLNPPSFTSATGDGGPFTPLEGANLTISSSLISGLNEGSDIPGVPSSSVDKTITVGDGNTRTESINMYISSSGTHHNHKKIRRHRTESDQQQRNVLRDGFAQLKSALPNPTQPTSRAAILSGAADYIRQFKAFHMSLQTRLDSAESELTRLKAVNEQLTQAVIAAVAMAQGVSSMGPTASF